MNSIIYAVTAGLGSVFLASIGSYALVQLKTRAPRAWFLDIFLGTLFVSQGREITTELQLSAGHRK
jgi:ABC-type glycerol-3-phosphate transport system permease component